MAPTQSTTLRLVADVQEDLEGLGLALHQLRLALHGLEAQAPDLTPEFAALHDLVTQALSAHDTLDVLLRRDLVRGA